MTPDSWVFLLFEIVINLFMIVDLSLKMRLHVAILFILGMQELLEKLEKCGV